MQFLYHTLFDKVFNDLQDKNTGRCKKTGKSYGEVMPFFVLVLDKMCIMLDAHGDTKVVILADKKRHNEMEFDWYVIF